MKIKFEDILKKIISAPTVLLFLVISLVIDVLQNLIWICICLTCDKTAKAEMTLLYIKVLIRTNNLWILPDKKNKNIYK